MSRNLPAKHSFERSLQRLGQSDLPFVRVRGGLAFHYPAAAAASHNAGIVLRTEPVGELDRKPLGPTRRADGSRHVSLRDWGIEGRRLTPNARHQGSRSPKQIVRDYIPIG
jgi:hypothetical protein